MCYIIDVIAACNSRPIPVSSFMEEDLKKNKFLITGILLIILFCGVPLQSTFAGPLDQEDQPTIVPNEYCLSCHDTPGLTTPLPSGEDLYIGVDSVQFATSVHGRLGYACVQCHTDRTEGIPRGRSREKRHFLFRRQRSGGESAATVTMSGDAESVYSACATHTTSATTDTGKRTTSTATQTGVATTLSGIVQ